MNPSCFHPSEDQKAQDAFDNPAELYRLWKEEGNLLAAQFLGNKHHWGDEGNGIFINPDRARDIYEEIRHQGASRSSDERNGGFSLL